MNAQKESLKKLPESLKKLPFTSSRCVMKMKVELEEKKRRAHKNVFDGRREFIGRLWKSSIIDRKEPQVDDC